MSNSLRPHELYSPRNSQGQNTRVGNLSPVELPNPGIELGSPESQADSLPAELYSVPICTTACPSRAPPGVLFFGVVAEGGWWRGAEEGPEPLVSSPTSVRASSRFQTIRQAEQGLEPGLLGRRNQLRTRVTSTMCDPCSCTGPLLCSSHLEILHDCRQGSRFSFCLGFCQSRDSDGKESACDAGDAGLIPG